MLGNFDAAYGRDRGSRQEADGIDAAMRDDRIRCHTLEAAMLAEPHASALRTEYFAHLRDVSARHTGIGRAELPELGHPLFFRAGSSDIDNMAQVFRDHAYGFAMPVSPGTILDLGAYVGYAAIALARRFPQAEILCVEPAPDSFRLLAMNTAAYKQITCINAAVWSHPTQLAVGARHDGDWGTHLREAMPADLRRIPAHTVPELLALAGWDTVDMLKCDIEGAEAEVFADRGQNWLAGLDALVVETHESIAPGAADAIAACFDSGLFEHFRDGEHDIYLRRTEPLEAVRPSVCLLSSTPGLAPMHVEKGVEAPYGFFSFDGACCQLHPPPPGEAPSRIVFPRTLDGQRQFAATLHHAGAPAATITFSLTVEQPDGRVVASAEHALASGERLDWEIGLPPLHGPHRVVLQTEMSPGAAHNYNGWARWEMPTLS